MTMIRPKTMVHEGENVLIERAKVSPSAMAVPRMSDYNRVQKSQEPSD